MFCCVFQILYVFVFVCVCFFFLFSASASSSPLDILVWRAECLSHACLLLFCSASFFYSHLMLYSLRLNASYATLFFAQCSLFVFTAAAAAAAAFVFYFTVSLCALFGFLCVFFPSSFVFLVVFKVSFI